MQLIALDGSDNQYELDIEKGSPVTADFNFKDIKDLKSKGSHTYNFRLPSSVANEKYFGHYFMVGSYFAGAGSYNPFARREAYLLQDTIEVFRGFIQLTNVYLREGNKYEYECILFSPEVNFLDSLKGLKFNQLNYLEWQHTLTPNNIYNSYVLEDIDNGNLIWSFWDYGMGLASNDTATGYDNWFGSPGGTFLTYNAEHINMRLLRPQARVKSLIDKIMEYSGYTYTSAFLDSAYFSKIYCDLNWSARDSVKVTVPAQDYYVQALNSTTQTINTYSGTFSQLLVADTEISDVSNSWSQQSTAGYTFSKWTNQRSGSYVVTMEADVTFATPQVDGNMGFAIYKNADFSSIPYAYEYVGNGSQYGQQVTGGTVTFSTTINTQSVGDEFFFAWWNSDLVPEMGVTIANFKIVINAVNTQGTSNQVYVPNLFGDLSCEAWMRGIMQKFNLVVVPNKNDSKNLLIEPYNDYTDSGTTKDWSNKIDFKKDVQIIPPTKYSGRKVVFSDEQKGDYVSETLGYNNVDEFGYGSYIEPGIQNQFSEKNTQFKTIFSPTINYPLNGMNTDLGFYSCARFGINNGVKKNVGGMCLSFYHGTHSLPTNKVYKLNYANTGESGSFDGADRTLVPFFSEYDKKNFTQAQSTDTFSINWHTGIFVPVCEWDALAFKGSVKKYWANYILDNFNVNSRMLSCHMRLTPRDIADFTFGDVITINSQNYKINSIKGYPISSTGVCKVELLATFESINVPIVVGGGGTSSTDPFGGFIECPYEPVFFNIYTGIGTFNNTTLGTTQDITQDCCVSFGLYWNEDNDKCYNAPPDDNDSQPPIGDGTIGSDDNTDLDDNTITGGGGGNGWGQDSMTIEYLYNHDIKGKENELYKPDEHIIKGDKNKIKEMTKRVAIFGSQNDVGLNVRTSTINGNENQIRTIQSNQTLFTENVTFSTTINDVVITGDNAIARINGDRIQSVKLPNTTPVAGTSQRGEFIVKFRTDGNYVNNPVGQYGLIEFTNGKYNSIANKDAIRFSDKSNIIISTELIGVSEIPVDNVFSTKALIRKTFQVSQYIVPNVLSSSTEFSDISTALGSVDYSIYPLLKIPYTTEQSGIAFNVFTDRYRDAINWTLKVSYETTPLASGTLNIIPYPPYLADCELWLDASNEASVIVNGSDDVQEWKDISGQTNHVLQASSTYKPKYRRDNWDKPYIDFDGSSANLTSTDVDLRNLFNFNNTFVVVYKSDITTAEYYGQVLVGGNTNNSFAVRCGLRVNANGNGGAGGSDSITFSNQISTTNFNACNIPNAGVTNYSIAVGRKTGTTCQVFDGNGNTDTESNGINQNSIARFCIGGSSYNGTSDIAEFNGRIYEVFAYADAKSDAEIEKIISYCKTKWNIQ